MIKIDRHTEMAELNENATEGQFADYLAAEESSDFGAWSIGLVSYQCSRCGYSVDLVFDSLPNYDGLIVAWHRKAMQGDYFSKYAFECIAFTAYVKSNIGMSALTDRDSIQNLKRNERLREDYLRLIERDSDLRDLWTAVIEELNVRPLHNSSRDFDNPEIDNWWNNPLSNENMEQTSIRGVIHSLRDWGNMVEFWYSVRNNLFHGGKEPNILRDQFLVEHAFRTLYPFMANRIAEFDR